MNIGNMVSQVRNRILELDKIRSNVLDEYGMYSPEYRTIKSNTYTTILENLRMFRRVSGYDFDISELRTITTKGKEITH